MNLFYHFTNKSNFSIKRDLAFQYWSNYFSLYLSFVLLFIGFLGCSSMYFMDINYSGWASVLLLGLAIVMLLLQWLQHDRILKIPISQIEDILASEQAEFVQQAKERIVIDN